MLRNRADEHMMTAEELRVRAQKRRRVLLVLATVLVLGSAIVMGGKPARNAIKGWQSRRHAAEAFELIQQANWPAARDKAVAAYHLRPTEPQALRAVARFLSKTGQQQALEFWDKLKQQTSLTRDDLHDEAAIALLAADDARAQAAIEKLTSTESASGADWLLAAQLHLRRGETDNAAAAIQKALSNPRCTRQDRFRASLLQLQSAQTGNLERDRREQREAWARIDDLSREADPTALEALTLLAQRRLATSREATNSSGRRGEALNEPTSATDNPELQADELDPALNAAATAPAPSEDAASLRSAEELASALDQHPLSKMPQKLTSIDLLIYADPTQRAALIDRAIRDWKDADPVSLATLARWLNNKGEFQRQLETIPLEAALRSVDLFLQHVDALAALGRWDEIKSLLESERFPLDPVIQSMYLARCNAKLEQTTAAANSWQRALEAAAGDLRKLMGLASYAERNGELKIAGAAYDAAVAIAPATRELQTGRLRIAQAEGDTQKAHAILEEMLRIWPQDPAVRNDEAYTRTLLLATDPVSPELKELEASAQALIERGPNNLSHRTLLALIRLKQKRSSDALNVYQDVSIPVEKASPAAITTYAAVLAANGHSTDAQTLAGIVNPQQLLPQERELLTAAKSP